LIRNQLEAISIFYFSTPLQRSSTRNYLEFLKSLLLAASLRHLERVEAHSLAQWATLANSDDISDLHILEARAKMNRHVLMPLLKAIVLLDVVKVIATNNNRSLHLHFLSRCPTGYDHEC